MELDDIINLPYETFVEKLKDLAKDSKVSALLKAGREDGLPNDEKIMFGEGTIPANKLIPMQQELLLEKSVKWAVGGHHLDFVKNIVKGLPISGNPVVTLNGKYIIDGHHRWVETYSLNPVARIQIYDMKLNVTPIEAYKIIQIAIAASSREIPYSKSDGTNLYTASRSVIEKYVSDNISDDVVELFKLSKEDAIVHIADNILELKKNNPPSPDAPSRLYMPQPAAAPNWDEKLKSGEINYKKPFVKEMKRIVPSFDEYLNEKLNEESVKATRDSAFIQQIISI